MKRFIVVSVVGIISMYALFFLAEYLMPKPYGFDYSGAISNVARITILVFATYFGIFAHVLTKRLDRTRATTISIKQEIATLGNSKDFWRSLIASPVVLFAAYSAIEQVTSLMLVFTIAFQNGFFFKAITPK